MSAAEEVLVLGHTRTSLVRTVRNYPGMSESIRSLVVENIGQFIGTLWHAEATAINSSASVDGDPEAQWAQQVMEAVIDALQVLKAHSASVLTVSDARFVLAAATGLLPSVAQAALDTLVQWGSVVVFEGNLIPLPGGTGSLDAALARIRDGYELPEMCYWWDHEPSRELSDIEKVHAALPADSAAEVAERAGLPVTEVQRLLVYLAEVGLIHRTGSSWRSHSAAAPYWSEGA